MMVTTGDPVALVLHCPGLLHGGGLVIRAVLWRLYKASTSKIKCPISCASAVISLVTHTGVECCSENDQILPPARSKLKFPVCAPMKFSLKSFHHLACLSHTLQMSLTLSLQVLIPLSPEPPLQNCFPVNSPSSGYVLFF